MSRILLFKLVVTGVKIIDVNHTMLSPFQNITAILNSYSCLRCRTLRCEERTWRNISLPNRKGNVEKITFWNTFILCFCVRSYFICERWLAVEQDDGAVDRVLPVATKAELTQFSQLFFTSSREKLFDDHLWFSLFTRPTKRYVPNYSMFSLSGRLIQLGASFIHVNYQSITPINPKQWIKYKS